jgi:trk system potassium uptake protein TrkA
LKIIIIGAGEVGYDLASLLVQENHEVTILDHDRHALSKCSESLDALTTEGSATSVKSLVESGVRNADIVVAATSIDEVNIIASMMSKRLGAKMVIARVRNDEITHDSDLLSPADLGIDVLIHPEDSAAQEIVQLVKRTAATDVLNLADSHIQLIGIRIDKKSPLVGISMQEYAKKLPSITFRVVAIHRGGITLIPFGNDRFRPNDQVFILALTEDMPDLVKSTGQQEHPIENIMIAGGTYIGHKVAKILRQESTRWNIKLIEPDYEKAFELAETLKGVLVLNGNPTDPNLLATEGIAEMDAFIAVTDDEESNIISCLMAKHLEVPKTVALVSKADYIPLSQTIGLDAAVNKKLSASNEIHRYVWGKTVLRVTALHGIRAEVLEFQASKGSKITEKPIFRTSFPRGCVVGGLIRDGAAQVAVGSTQILEGDRVLVFTLPESISAIAAMF